MLRFVFATLMLAILSALPSFSHAVENGTRAIVSDLSYWGVITRLEAAIKRRDLRIVSRESVRGADRQKKLGIPGNMVIGAFGDEYTTRILRANVAAGIEAPIRFYVTRDADEKTTTLWYRRPSWVLASYSDKSGALRAIGEELDRVMEAIAEEATEATKRTERLLSKRDAGTPKPAPQKPKARAPERVAKPAPVKDKIDTKAVKAVAKRTEPAKPSKSTKSKTDKVTAAAVAKPEAANPPKRLGPKPLIPGKTETATARETPQRPVARAAPKPLGPARTAPKTPKQGDKAPLETARRDAETPVERKRLPPVAKRDPDRDAITLTPLMLKLQGQ